MKNQSEIKKQLEAAFPNLHIREVDGQLAINTQVISRQQINQLAALPDKVPVELYRSGTGLVIKVGEGVLV